MNQRITLIILLFLCSCTITKRVHRGGYYVQWNKNYGINMDAAQEEDGDAIESSPKDLIETIGEIDEVADTLVPFHKDTQVEGDFVSEENPSESNVPIYYEEPPPKNQKITVIDNYIERIKGIEIVKDPFKGEEKLSEGNSVNAGLLRVLGIIMICFGGMLIIASLFLFFGFNGLAGLFASLVFSGNGFVAGLLGFLLFLLILLVLILFVLFVQVIGGSTVGLIIGGSLILIGLLFLLFGYLLGG
jgi:hypothetical protein